MDEGYRQPLDVRRLATESGFSPYHFIREYSRAFKETPHRYLMRRRMERAKELLRTAEIPVTQVCIEVGFRSHGSFSAAFSRYVGRSPMEYRAAMARESQPRTVMPACFLTMLGPDRRPTA